MTLLIFAFPLAALAALAWLLWAEDTDATYYSDRESRKDTPWVPGAIFPLGRMHPREVVFFDAAQRNTAPMETPLQAALRQGHDPQTARGSLGYLGGLGSAGIALFSPQSSYGVPGYLPWPQQRRDLP